MISTDSLRGLKSEFRSVFYWMAQAKSIKYAAAFTYIVKI